jgi:hypothetical protein
MQLTLSAVAHSTPYHPAPVCQTVLLFCSGRVLAFKALLAGAPGAASTQSSIAAKGLASGSYTIWRDSGEGVGATQTPVSAATFQDCLTACDISSTCAGIAVVTNGGAFLTAAVVSCSLIKGDSSVGTFKRSVTRVVVGRLTTAVVGEVEICYTGLDTCAALTEVGRGPCRVCSVYVAHTIDRADCMALSCFRGF